MKKEYITLYRYKVDKDSNFSSREIKAINTKYGYKTKGGVKIKVDELDKLFLKKRKDLIVYSFKADLDENIYKDLVRNIDADKMFQLSYYCQRYYHRVCEEKKNTLPESNTDNIKEKVVNRRVYSEQHWVDALINNIMSDLDKKLANTEELRQSVTNLNNEVKNINNNSHSIINVGGKKIEVKNNKLYINNKYIKDAEKGNLMIKGNIVFLDGKEVCKL